MSHLLLTVLLDAFRPDYLRFTEFLSYLAHQGAMGEFVEPFGFAPRAAYFGGLSPNDVGYSQQFWYDPDASPFSPARYISAVSHSASPNSARTFLEMVARQRTTPYVASYLTSAEIPLERLASFDFPEQYAPWDKRVGYRSLFHQLDDMGLPWFQCAWPDTNKLRPNTDEAIIGHTVRSLRREHRFAFIQLSSLDAAGHKYGPESIEVAKAAKQIDLLIRTLMQHCVGLYDKVDLVAFGDHGMISVVRHLDVEKILQSLPVMPGRDYDYFLDSTVARFWFKSAHARESIEHALGTACGGRLLTRRDLEAYQIEHCDSRNGELLFLADPGVLIMPNFFQRTSAAQGMHGYDPMTIDNRGVLVINPRDGWGRLGPGPTNAHQLHSILSGLLGLIPPHPATEFPMPVAPRQSGQYTINNDTEIDRVVDSHIEVVVDNILAEIEAPQAILLTGGFGRGEGSITRRSNDGAIQPMNDYDFIVISETASPANLKALGTRLARIIGIDYVDIGVFRYADLIHGTPTMLKYDLRYGSQVVCGDPTVLERSMSYASCQIPPVEGLTILFNRCAGLLLSVTRDVVTDARLTGNSASFLRTQLAKSLLAIADWHLLHWHAYTTSYRAKQRRFSELGAVDRLPPRLLELVDQAFDEKLGRSERWAVPTAALISEVSSWVCNGIVAAIRSQSVTTNEIDTRALAEALGDWRATIDPPSNLGSLYSGLALLLRAVRSPNAIDRYALELAQALAAELGIQSARDEILAEPLMAYENMRQALTALWETQCH